MINPHNLQAPQLVHLDTVVSIFIAFAVACVSTSIQGLVAHAFRQTIGDIVVSDNSLGDIDHIAPMLPAPVTPLKQNPTRLTERRSWMSSHKNNLYSTIDQLEDTTHTQKKNSHYTDMDPTHGDLQFGSKRLDARGFFQTM